MILSWFVCLFIFIQEEIPFKPKEDFEVKLNYSFKQRPSTEGTTFRYDVQAKDRENQNTSSMLPYLVLNVKILKVSIEEVKFKVVNNMDGNVMSKKVQNGSELSIDIGFTDDVKDRVSAHEYIIYLLNDKRKEQSKILIFVEEGGAFLINGEVRGKL